MLPPFFLWRKQMAMKQTAKKKTRPGKTAQYLADLKHMGDEPDVKGKNINDTDLARAFNWYNYMCTRVQAREYIETYFKNKKRNQELKKLKLVPDAWINLQAGWYAQIMNRGGILNEYNTSKFETRIKEMFAKVGTKPDLVEVAEDADGPKPTKADLKDPQPKISIQDRIKEKVSSFIGEFDEAIDREGWTLSMYDWLQKKQVPANQAKIVADFFKPIADEANEVLKKGCDPQLKEGYSSYTAAQLKQRAAFYNSILADCARHASNNKKRIVRKKKDVTPEKKLKNLKYQKESKEFKIVSINPEKMLGAEELVTFNTKYKTLTHFYALDRAGLGVKGTTIVNYDETKSKSYRIGRKTEEHVDTALRGGKRVYNKMLESLKTCTLQHRINENTILLRI